MATKYWRFKLKGEKSVERIQSAVGQNGGLVVRVHFDGDSTRVYFSGGKPTTKGLTKALAGAGKPVAVNAAEVMRLD